MPIITGDISPKLCRKREGKSYSTRMVGGEGSPGHENILAHNLEEISTENKHWRNAGSQKPAPSAQDVCRNMWVQGQVFPARSTQGGRYKGHSFAWVGIHARSGSHPLISRWGPL